MYILGGENSKKVKNIQMLGARLFTSSAFLMWICFAFVFVLKKKIVLSFKLSFPFWIPGDSPHPVT